MVEILPKKTGLLHISQIAHERVEKISEFLTVGERIEVKLMEVTPDGKFKLSRKILLPRPQHTPNQEHSNNDRGHQDRGHHERSTSPKD